MIVSPGLDRIRFSPCLLIYRPLVTLAAVMHGSQRDLR